MKKSVLLLATILVSASAFSQLRITIKGAHTEFLSAMSCSDSKISNIAKLPKTGVGTLHLAKFKKEDLVVLGYNDTFMLLWASPNEEIEVNTIDGTNTGKHKKINQYLKNWQEKFVVDKNLVMENSFLHKARRRHYKEYGERLLDPKYLTELKTSTREQLKELRKSGLKNQVFTDFFKQFIDENYWLSLVKTDLVLKSKHKDTPGEILEELVKIDLNSAFFTGENKDLLIYGYIQANEGLGLIAPTLEDYIYQKASTINNKNLQEYYILKQLKQLISRNESLNVESLFKSSFPLIESEAGKRKYHELFHKITSNNYDNKEAVGFTAFDLEGKEVNLEQFRGKYVYIDIWATWCGPCKQMTPHFMKLADKYKDRNIVFLSLSVDNASAKQKWMDYVNKHFSENCVAAWTATGFKTPFVKHYEIKAIPRFMLVDPKGIMLANQFWNPMDPRVKTLLDKLLK